MTLVCQSCFGIRVIGAQERRQIAEELAAQPAAARKILECPCGLGSWALGLSHCPKPRLLKNGTGARNER